MTDQELLRMFPSYMEMCAWLSKHPDLRMPSDIENLLVELWNRQRINIQFDLCKSMIKQLEDKLSRVAAERDAAVKLIPHICANCILKDGPCKIRDEGGIRYGAYTCGVFEWCGAQGGA